MFSQSTASRILLKARNPSNLVQQPKRMFQNYGTGATGFERMFTDKLGWAGLSSLGGMGFVLFGLGNIGLYGLSLVMHKPNFDYHFAYTGNGKLLQPLKSMMAAESLANVAWTAPSLIAGGLFLNSRVGSIASFKIFWLSLFAAYVATSSLGPATNLAKMNIRGLSPIRWDSIDTDRQRMVGADLMAGMCLYSCLFSAGLWIPGAAFAAFDVAYYGPMGIAMPSAAAIAALTLL